MARYTGSGTKNAITLPDPLFELDDDANTPLTPEECEQLIPSYITLRHELNEAEQVNIGAALRWADGRKRDVLDRDFPTYGIGLANIVQPQKVLE